MFAVYFKAGGYFKDCYEIEAPWYILNGYIIRRLSSDGGLEYPAKELHLDDFVK